MWPVIQRELRAEARSTANRRLRFYSAALALLTLFFWTVLAEGGGADHGLRTFAALHGLTCCVIWVFVPLMTADCISREVREGTLGLLFLTPLKASGIMAGKALVQLLRAMTVWWAGLPALAVPLVMGGVQMSDFTAAFIIQLGSILLALAVGLLASSYCRRRQYAMITATVGAIGCLMVVGTLFGQALMSPMSPASSPLGVVTLGLHRLAGGWIHWEVFGMPLSNLTGPFLTAPAIARKFFTPWLVTVIKLALFCAVVLLAVLARAGRRLNEVWKDRVLTERELAVKRIWLTPRYGLGWFRRRQRGLLDRNPIGWLQQYAVADRLLKWGLCIVVLCWETLVFRDYNYGSSYRFQENQYWTALFVSVMLAFSAAGSFRRERETGALELILVSPVREFQLVFGRLTGIWWQFLPALIPLLLVWLFWWEHGLEVLAAGLVVDFIVLPLVGFYLSLKLRNFFTVWILTALAAWLIPMLPWLTLSVLSWLSSGRFGDLGDEVDDIFYIVIQGMGLLLELILGLAVGARLLHNLAHRRFVVHRGE